MNINNSRSFENIKDSKIKKRKKKSFFNFPLAFYLCIAAGFFSFGVLWMIRNLSFVTLVGAIITSSIVYLISIAAIIVSLLFVSRSASGKEIILHQFDRMLDNMVFPYIITNSAGIIVKSNRAAEKLFKRKMPGSMPDVSSVLPFLSPEIIKKSVGSRSELQWRSPDGSPDETTYFSIESTETVISDNKKEQDAVKGSYFLTTIIDMTKEKKHLAQTARRLETETAAIGRVEIDDLKSFVASSGVSEKEASDKVREILTDWTIHQNGIIYEPETRKFIIIMPVINLNQCIKDKFPVLDTVREAVSTKDDELTISMGFSATGATLSERMKNADAAFEQRKSGNKAVVNTAGEFSFFGKDRRLQNSRGSSEYRRIGHSLRKYIAESGNVLIMGHSRPDYDSVGSAIGLAKLACDLGKDWNIVINDENDVNFARLTEDIIGTEAYEGRFIDETKALEKARSNTLLIITDVNKAEYFESPALYKAIRTAIGGRIMIFDHHEKSDESAECNYEYINTLSSSSCEIIAGVLDLMLHRVKLTSEEATIILSGIMLDTKNFTQYASGKTHAAAEYLSLCAASAERAKKFFEADYETISSEFSIGSNVTLLCDGKVAFCQGSGLEDEGKTKIVIGRIADKMLGIKDVQASVVVAEWDGRVNASARSDNNTVNCAKLLSGIGGGNFNNAGARSTELSVNEFCKIIKENIDIYFAENFDSDDKSDYSAIQ